ncbi:hydroxymethylglutaryl-CoA reductase, degradative [Loigolactobacillus backii]|uniref:hydroxymethylglutaryl-CoA reductase, degradative n=1 Tax=Loigolactobacillus backii TaxID=375175 RepID=UPI000C1CB158|nr:hydroxymethylglutaryl-CoA reductase, degradative [Loigolactobacillus backii]PIO84291.1 hydroxymethylglutaryl-CoA reductase, degradative [Loigolactobacillus backii]
MCYNGRKQKLVEAKVVKFYQQSRLQRLTTLRQEGHLDNSAYQYFLNDQGLTQERANQLMENQLTLFPLPEGVARQVLVDGEMHDVPMVTEEPSVIAAASNGAKMAAQGTGFQTKIQNRQMIGQIILENVAQPERTKQNLLMDKTHLLEVANAAHPSIVKRGGGAKDLRVRILGSAFLSVDLIVDVKQAMGANMLNTMLEAVASELTTTRQDNCLMSILSNYATESLVTASCVIPVSVFEIQRLAGNQVAAKICAASQVAQLDPYRAATHNKGIMNGIDAAVIASGNDFRAIESGAQAYAARDGQYRGLSQWHVHEDKLVGALTLPLPLGFVGGATKTLPIVQANQKLAGINSAEDLMRVVAAIGLAQNLAALKALVTTGIQKGHMALQAKSLAISAGATTNEVQWLTAKLLQTKKFDLRTAKLLLRKLRQA